MLKINVKVEGFNEETNEFLISKEYELVLEHSLLSISKWESITHKIFLSDNDKTAEEILLYIKCMTIGKVEDEAYNFLNNKEITQIVNYINNDMTATKICDHSENNQGGNYRNEELSSELIYYYMISYGIPFKCEKWHLNRLLTLIRVCKVKNNQGGNNKLSMRETYSNNRELNRMRRQAMHSKG